MVGPEDVAGSPRSRGGAPPSPAGAWGPRGAPAGARTGMCLWNDTWIAPHPWPPELWGWQFPSSRTLAGKCRLPGPAEPPPLPAPRSGGSSTCCVLSSHGPSTAQCPTYGRGNVHKHSESPRGGSTRSGPGASPCAHGGCGACCALRGQGWQGAWKPSICPCSLTTPASCTSQIMCRAWCRERG